MARLQSLDSIEVTSALRHLVEGDFETRWDVAKRLVRLGPAILPPLLELLSEAADDSAASDEQDLELQWFIARILGDLQHPVAVDALLELVKTTPHPELAAIAANSLAKAGNLALFALTELLQNQEHRILAAQALAQIGHSQAIPALISVVEDSDAEVRAVAIEALTAFRDVRITPILAQALEDNASAVRLAALRGIGSRGHQLPHIEALVTRIGELLGDLNIDVGCQAAIALSRLNTPTALEHLDQALQHRLMPLALKIQIVRSLAWCESQPTLEKLQQFLQQSILTVVAPSQTSTSEVASPEKDSGLSQTQCLNLEVVRVLGRIDDRSLAPAASTILLKLLQQLPNTGTPNVQSPGHLPDKHPGETHLWELKAHIALGLGQLGHPQAFEPLIHLLSNATPNLKFHILAALKQLYPEDGHHQLMEYRRNLPQEQLADLAPGIDFALKEWSLHESRD